MVKWICFVFLTAVMHLSAEVKVSASIDGFTHLSNEPLKGTISVTHLRSEKIDPKSVKIGGVDLPVTFIQDTQISSSSDLIVSFYTFSLPPKPKGLHILPEITVKVNGEPIKSIASTYEVNEAGTSSPAVPYYSRAQTVPQAPSGTPAVAEQNAANAVLKFDASYDAQKPIYPGQRIRMIYRYYFKTNIELTEENLPLLDPPGFTKIGSKDVQDSQSGDYSLREISQVIVADKPGRFDFPKSSIEGYVYRLDDSGNKQYQKPKISIETLPFSLEVLPFPDQGRPASFNGAIGTFDSFVAALTSSEKVAVGDKLQLGLDLTGKGVNESTPAPDLCCQPGFSGVFQPSDLPPVSLVEGTSKHFEVELRPLTTTIKAIPPIEFAYFNPDTKSYGTLHSAAIPITVESTQPVAAPRPTQVDESWQKPNSAPEEPLFPWNDSAWQIWNRFWYSAWWIFLLIPAVIGALLWQKRKKRIVEEEKAQPRKLSSADLLTQALVLDPKTPPFQHLLTQAFAQKMVEKKLIPSAGLPVEKWPQVGPPGEARALLLELEELRFSGRGQEINMEIRSKAQSIFNQL